MDRLTWSCRRLAVLTFIVGLIAASGCGEGEDPETVYLHFFNAYPGAESVDVIGPTGVVATDLAFGERTEEPVAVNRNFGSEFTLLIEGAPDTYPIDQQLFTLYPHETATLAIIQRDETAVMTSLVRHVQSIARECRLVINNSLSVQSDDLGEYAFISGLDMDGRLDYTGYARDADQEAIAFVDSRIDTESREQMWEDMPDHPYFAVTTASTDDESSDESGPDEENGQQDDEQANGEDSARQEGSTIWMGPEEDVRANYAAGTVESYPHSQQYIACLMQQHEDLQAVEEDEEGAEEQIEEILARDCNDRRPFPVLNHQPALEQVAGIIQYRPEAFGNPNTDCNMGFRVFSDFDNIFQGEHGYDGYEGNVRVDYATDNFRVSDHYFAVLYGRPVNPIWESWRASEHFTEMPDYPADSDSSDE